jgi:two-component system LytT family response regulator/two-component system response regulator LytT
MTTGAAPNASDDAPVRVLVVDDDTLLLRAIERLLRGRGLAVFLESNPLHALERLQREAFDIVLSDHGMPALSGVELLRHVRDLHPHALRVLVTGDADAATARAALDHACVDHTIEKPWSTGELQTVVTALSARVRERKH